MSQFVGFCRHDDIQFRQRQIATDYWRCVARSQVLQPRAISFGHGVVRIRFVFAMRTLLRLPFQPVVCGGPIDAELHYRIVTRPQAAAPLCIRLRGPQPLFHPAVSWEGRPCLGAVTRALADGWPLDIAAVLAQLWDGLRYDPRVLDLSLGQVSNPPAAMFVRKNLANLPLNEKPLYQAEPAPDLLRRPIIPLDSRWLAAEQLSGDHLWQPVLQRQLSRARSLVVIGHRQAIGNDCQV